MAAAQQPVQPESQANANLDKYSWLLRPCSVYKEELRVCQTSGYRRHHIFVTGEPPSCDQWALDHANCLQQGDERSAFEALVLSEMRRRHARLKAMTGNNVWQYRDQPPADWDAPLPAGSAATLAERIDARVLEAADNALEASFEHNGVLGSISLGARLSQCALM